MDLSQKSTAGWYTFSARITAAETGVWPASFTMSRMLTWHQDLQSVTLQCHVTTHVHPAAVSHECPTAETRSLTGETLGTMHT